MGGGQSFPTVQLSRERIVVVTGGNTGIGYEIAKWIAMMGATVIIACRSEERAKKAIVKMNEDYKAEKAKGTPGLTDSDSLAVEFMECNLSSFQSTKAFTDNFKSSGRPLHVLVCNAGIGFTAYSKTEDGNENMNQVNYLSHFLMIGKLLPVMKTSGEDCRIFLVSSMVHKMGNFNLDTMNYEKGRPDKFPRMDYYGRSKLYQIMQMYSMSRRLKDTNITVNCMHPGYVDTELDRGLEGWGIGKTMHAFGTAFGIPRTPLVGAKSAINGAVNPTLKGVSGIYYIDCKPATPSATSRNESKQEALWIRTLELLKEHLTEDEVKCLEGQNT